MMNSIEVLQTDVAIVGGGAAGTYAALELQRAGVGTVVLCKGLVGKSGASIFAGNLVIGGRLLGNTEQNARDTAEFLVKYHNQFLIDQNWARSCGEWIENVYYPELEAAGLYFRRDDEGNVVVSPGEVRSIAANVQGNSGVPFMDLRRKQIIRANIKCFEECAVTALLRRPDGSVGGVFGLNYVTGQAIVVRSRAVILATGYSDRLHARSTGTREMSGDGIAMAWRAGASLVDASEVDAYTTYGKSFRQLGLPFPQTLVETAVTAHYRQGGIDVDTRTMRTTVPGLYVAGGIGGHSNGLIGLATYDGRTAAQGVLDELARLKPGEFPWSEVENEQRRLAAFLVPCAPDGITPAKVKEKIRAMMWQKVGVEKDAAGLRSALADIEHFRRDLLPRMGLKRTAPSLNYEWLDAIDAVNMIDACELIIHSSLERAESRGPFMRHDFPQTDNAIWLAANVMHRTENGFCFERRPYELPFFQPDFVRKDNLEVAW